MKILILFLFSAHSFEVYKNMKVSKCEYCVAKKFVDFPPVLKNQTTYPNGGINPSAYICKRVGGTYKRKHKNSLCVFKDKSFINAWDLVEIVKVSK